MPGKGFEHFITVSFSINGGKSKPLSEKPISDGFLIALAHEQTHLQHPDIDDEFEICQLDAANFVVNKEKQGGTLVFPRDTSLEDSNGKHAEQDPSSNVARDVFSPRKTFLDKEIFMSPEKICGFFSPLLDVEPNKDALQGIKTNFPEICGYLKPFKAHLNYDLEKPATEECPTWESDLTLINHVLRRGVGMKILGLDRGDIDIFQTNASLSQKTFNVIVNKFMSSIKQSGLLQYFLIAFLYHDVSKAGLSKDRLKWAEIEGIDLLIPNKASALILRNLTVADSEVPGLFENMEILNNKPQFKLLNEFFYQLIAMRGFPGQFIRGEVSYEIFQQFSDWIRANFKELKEALGSNLDDETVARKITDIIYLFNLIYIIYGREYYGVRHLAVHPHL